MEEREEWDDEVKRCNEELTFRVEDQEREEEGRFSPTPLWNPYNSEGRTTG